MTGRNLVHTFVGVNLKINQPLWLRVSLHCTRPCAMGQDMTEIEKAVERIRKFLKARPHWSVGGFAKRAGLHRNTLYGLHEEPWNPPRTTLDKCLIAIDAIEAEEARAKPKRTPKIGAEAPQRAA